MDVIEINETIAKEKNTMTSVKEENTMTVTEKAKLNMKNIRVALEDYGRYTDREVLEDVTEEFIQTLAIKNAQSKHELRELFRKSPAWDEELDAIVINGTRTHNPDMFRIRRLIKEIIGDLYWDNSDIFYAATFFWTTEEEAGESYADYRRSLDKVAPKAYAPGKKMSRVFKAFCDAIGVSNNTAGSDFQRLYAQVADEMQGRQIDYKLFVSLNPAHFITMSNPKRDRRGTTLTSCHSFNSTEYSYNNGCSGYACDNYTFITFTVDDPTCRESLNNRKTTRQLFVYKPGSGILLQSRLYNTSGGTNGAQEESKEYRDLIQRELSDLEGSANLWKTVRYNENKEDIYFDAGDGFGGYPDWTYRDFDPRLSIRSDAENTEGYTNTIGTWGVCIVCGCDTDHGVYCEDCEDTARPECEECGDHHSSHELFTVHNRFGGEIQVCEDCRDRYYAQCHDCEEWYYADDMTEVDNDWVCEDCLEDNYYQCDYCGDYIYKDYALDAVDRFGNDVHVCEYCADNHYTKCDDCGTLVRSDEVVDAIDSNGNEIQICPSCTDNYAKCDECGRLVHKYYMTGELFFVCKDCAKENVEEEIA